LDKVKFIQRALELAASNVKEGKGGPFGAVVVKDGKIIAEGTNIVTSTNDPTAHAEIIAIRNACKQLGSFQLKGCQIYASCEPCPMCIGAIYWARPDGVYFAATRYDAADASFDDSFIYEELKHEPEVRTIPMTKLLSGNKEAILPFNIWKQSPNKIKY